MRVDRRGQTTGGRATSGRVRAGRELALLALLYAGYSAARLLANGDISVATTNAQRLLDIEGVLHLDVERWLNTWTQRIPGLALLASYWYSTLHYIVTPALLLWAYRAHARHYARVRNAIITATALGLVGFVLVPMAPPRMLPGYVDTLATTAGSGWWGADASAPRGLGSLTNELAAMPSLHVGWALWCVWVVFLCTRNSWARLAAAGYAAGTVLVVVGTANHYLLDAVAGAAVVGVGIALQSARGESPADVAQVVPAARRAVADVTAPATTQARALVGASAGSGTSSAL